MMEIKTKILEEFRDRLNDIDCDHWGEAYISQEDINDQVKWLSKILDGYKN